MLLSTLMLLAATASAAPLPNTPVPARDLARYEGRWHEVARLPMYFQRKCVADVTATYTRQPDGNITVDNACRTKDGKTQRALGEARPVPGKPGALEVRFGPEWLSWIPAVWADYWVVDLDPDYRWAVVGGPDRDAMWILSRTPALDKATFDDIRNRAKRRGYPVAELLISPDVK